MRVKVLFGVIIVLLVIANNYALADHTNSVISALLTTKGLSEEGYPLDYCSRFSLENDRGIQLFLAWSERLDEQKVEIKWYDPGGYLLKHLVLEGYSGNQVLDYLLLQDFAPEQMVIPQYTGAYEIHIYKEGVLVALVRVIVDR